MGAPRPSPRDPRAGDGVGRARRKLAATGRADPLDVEDLNDPERQISYMFKFVTYHRPGKIGRDGRARAYPLPPDRLAELATWWWKYQFSDFVFFTAPVAEGAKLSGTP